MIHLWQSLKKVKSARFLTWRWQFLTCFFFGEKVVQPYVIGIWIQNFISVHKHVWSTSRRKNHSVLTIFHNFTGPQSVNILEFLYFFLKWVFLSEKVEHHQILTFFDQKLFFRNLFRNVNYNTQSVQKWIFRCFWCVFHHKHLCEHSTTDQPKITTFCCFHLEMSWFLVD